MATGSPALRPTISWGTSCPATAAVAFDHLQHRRADAGPEVDGDRCVVVRQPVREQVERPDVGVGEVLDVDVVADARPVGRRVVLAVHLHWSAGAEDGLHDERDQVDRERPVLADHCVAARTSSVEVAKADRAEPGGDAVPMQDPLDHDLAVGVDALRRDRRRFGHGHVGRRAVDRARRGEDDVGDADTHRCLDERRGARPRCCASTCRVTASIRRPTCRRRSG